MRFSRAWAMAAVAFATTASAQGDILVGHVASMSGNEATFGDSTDKGIRLAIDELNKKGGVKGKKVALKTLDDQGKPEEAAVAATRLVTQDKVAVLLGEVASSRSLAMAPIADSNQVPMITPTSTNPKVTKDGAKTRPYVFRVCFIDPFQGTVMAKFSREKLKVTKVAILRDVGNDYSVGLADFFAKKFKELGGTIVSDQSYKAGDQDFKAQLTAIKGKNPRGDLRPRLLHRRGAHRPPGPRAGHEAAARWAATAGIPQALRDRREGALDGSLLLEPLLAGRSGAAASRSFVKKYKATYGAVPDALAALGYDAAKRRLRRHAARQGPQRPRRPRRPGRRPRASRASPASSRSTPDHNAVKSAVVLRHREERRQVRSHRESVIGSIRRRAGTLHRPFCTISRPRGTTRAPRDDCDRVPAAPRQWPFGGDDLRADRARLHDGVRRPEAHQLRSRRRLHGRRLLRPLPLERAGRRGAPFARQGGASSSSGRW